MTTVAEEDVLTAVELELTVDPITDEIEVAVDLVAPAAESGGQPFIRIVKGSPSDEEVAALVCVLTAAANSAAARSTGPADNWGRPNFMHRGSSPFSPYAFPQLSHLRD
ncbi:acyl-CoA carboxylase subunit epsilon [Nocardia sp. CWNU-33]|uniref:acyl-CoA carboxylase subunit epsilon n=1 Tax=Nocardia sp. CWNU-33 TaxID=3392117 RepID=UPI00398E5458